MNIDIERLKVDAEYWDEVAPKEATYYDSELYLWRQHDFGDLLYWDKKARRWKKPDWVELLTNRSNESLGLIPRPEQWQPARDNDLPEIGAERRYYNSEMNEVRECIVVAHRHGCAVVEDQDGATYEALPPAKFIRTKEQREREEFARAILDDLDALSINISGDTATAIAIGFMNRGWRMS